MFTEFDRLAMTRALALAERGLDTTHPNPRVGCVIARGDRIIGEGFHERAGEPHAEVMALRSAKEPVAGATAYVTLEPCSHHGRTPPCVNALIEARIARVVFAVQDPNPRVSGQGADALLRAGMTVEAGLMQNEATELNIGFMKRMKEGLPWVRVKLAMSLDGRTALANGASQWITGEPARADVQRWRARCSAVMTGVGTVLADDPQLNVRVAGFKGRQPLRVVLDARLRSPVGAKLFAGLGGVGSGVAGATGAGVGAAGGRAGVAGGGAGAARAPGAGVAASAGAGVAGAKPAAVGAAAVTGGEGASGNAGRVVGGDVVIFAAAGGGMAAATGGARGAAALDSSKLPGDMAELVNAFEASPTSVVARADNVAGAVSV
jgi:diaminohydroxyphosphoribosylaminopyrimidine deaminase/5-amino-6-(5-phosphoribosylamino)uracil reductase